MSPEDNSHKVRLWRAERGRQILVEDSVKKKSDLREFIEALVVAVILAGFIITFIVQSFVVEGRSMEPTLYDGQRLFVNKFIP